MTITQKPISVTIPFLFLGIRTLECWTYNQSRDAFYQSKEEAMSLVSNFSEITHLRKNIRNGFAL